MYHIRILPSQIIWETDRAYLIRLPRSRWKFWIGKKLIQKNQNSFMIMVFDDMEFKLVSDAGNEKIMTIDQLLDAFGFDMSDEIHEDLIDDT